MGLGRVDGQGLEYTKTSSAAHMNIISASGSRSGSRSCFVEGLAVQGRPRVLLRDNDLVEQIAHVCIDACRGRSLHEERPKRSASPVVPEVVSQIVG